MAAIATFVPLLDAVYHPFNLYSTFPFAGFVIPVWPTSYVIVYSLFGFVIVDNVVPLYVATALVLPCVVAPLLFNVTSYVEYVTVTSALTEDAA